MSVIVLALVPGRLDTRAVRDALAQSHRVSEVVVVGSAWEPALADRLREAVSNDGRVRLLPLARLGVAPAASRARLRVRAVQVLTAALPFVSGDWVTVCADDATMDPDFVATALERARRESLELVWAEDSHGLGDRAFAGVLWASGLAALAPSEASAWCGEAPDAAWWGRLVDAGVRAPGAPALARPLARRGHA